MRIAVTGTPGAGKTTVAPLLAARLGWDASTVHGVRELATEVGAVVGHDDADDADVIDLDVLEDNLPAGDLILEGHMAHLLEMDIVCVIRLDPDILRQRMEARGYAAPKVQENLEAEMMDLILQEALDGCPVVIQRNATGRSPEDLATAFAPSGLPTETSLDPVDWTDRL